MSTAVLMTALASAQEDYRLTWTRVETKPSIDGRVSGGEWPEAARRQGFFDADTRLVSDEQGEFWLASDETAVYFAARVKTDPRRIIADEYKQNVSLRGNDHMRLVLDPWGNGQSSNSFGVNASGGTEISLAGGRAAKTEWIGEFEARGAVLEDGWSIEAKIPWALMSLPATGERTLKFNVFWFRSNKSNTYVWKYSASGFIDAADWVSVLVPPKPRGRTLNLLPFGYTGIDNDSELIADAGLDLKTELSDDLTLVGTVNPDFRNIENSVLSLSFSYFERLRNESRPFFQEGSNFRYVGFDQRIFVPQRVTTVDAGVNLYGRVGPKTTLGLLTTADFGKSHALVASVGQQFARNMDGRFAYVGNYEKGKENHSVNAVFSVNRGSWNHYATLQYSDDEQRKSGSRLNVGVNTEAGGREFFAEYAEVSPGFFPRLGFSPERDYRGFVGGFNRELQYKSGPLTDLIFGVNGLYFTRLNGDDYRRNVSAFVYAPFRQDFALSVSGEASTFEGSHDHSANLGFSYPRNNPYRNIGFDATTGRIGGLYYQSLILGSNYRLKRGWDVSLSAQKVRLGRTSDQVILSTSYDLDRDQAIGGRLVAERGDVNWYLSYRQSGRRGNEFFLIIGDPNARTFQNQIVLKAVVPVTIRY